MIVYLGLFVGGEGFDDVEDVGAGVLHLVVGLWLDDLAGLVHLDSLVLRGQAEGESAVDDPWCGELLVDIVITDV